CQQYDNVPF
nr:immunoglobulin light chain junction region [Macaca mulatta]